MSKYAAVNVKFGADISGFSTAMQNAARQMQKAGQQLQDVGRSMTMNLTAPIAALGAAALYSFGQIDALKRGLISFSGSAAAAETEFTKLRDVAKLPGIGLEEAVKGSINLQAIGMSADDARVAMKAFGNAIATVGGGKDSFELAIRGFSQLTNASKPLQQDLYQIANQLPQVNKLMIEAFGTNRAEDLAAMGISGKQLADFLVTELGKLPQVSGGIKNSFENMGDSVKIALAKVGEAIEKNFNISDKINAVSSWLNSLADKFTNLNPALQKTILGLVGLIATLGPLILSIGMIVKLLPTLIAGWSVLKGAVIAARVAMISASTVMVGMPALFLGIVGAIGLAIISMNNWGKSASEATQKLKDQREEAKLLALERDKLANPDKYFKESKQAEIDFSFYDKPRVEGGYKGFQMGKGQDFEKGTKFKFAGDINIAKGKPLGTPKPTKDTVTDAEREAANAKAKKYGDENTEILNNIRRETKTQYDGLEQVHTVGLSEINRTVEEGTLTFGDKFKQWAIVLDGNAKGFNDKWNKFGQDFKNSVIHFNEIIAAELERFTEDTLVTFFDHLGTKLGQQRNPFEDLGNVLLESIGTFMSRIGALFITMGVSQEMFNTGLKAMNPYLMIAAGAALVTAGAAITSASRKGLEGARSGGSSGNVSSGSSGGQDLVLYSRLDGRDLVLSGQRTTAIGRR